MARDEKTYNFHNLENYSMIQLKEMAKKMNLSPARSKAVLINKISEAFSEYEKYHKEKIEKYKKQYQIGNKGKEGITYLVLDRKDNPFAMKTFRKTKATSTLSNEVKFQKKAGKAGISPKVYDYDTVSKYIVMDLLDKHLLDVIEEQKGCLKKKQQERIIEIFETLDTLNIFHGDVNLANYMIDKKGKIYIIDFGFAKEINDSLKRKLKCEKPNSELMLLGFILKLKDYKYDPSSYKYLSKNLSKSIREKYEL